MFHVIQNIRNGKLEVVQVPVPAVRPGHLVIVNACSVISAGTEKMVTELSQKSLLGKALARPDLVRQVLEKAKKEGILTTVETVRNRLDQSLSLGYSSAGTVIEVGEGVTGFSIGERVGCAGVGYAIHAEVVCVPKNLVVKLPENLDFESGALTTLGAIALQGIHLADAKLGEVVAVIGLGVLGQLTVQILKAAGCIVAGMDIQSQRAELARQLGADGVSADEVTLSSIVNHLSHGQGADAVIITADTASSEPVKIAGEIARDKGTIVAVGVVGLDIPRKIYYEKELDFRISRSYGPGRYDPEYEEKGHDYPIGYVRWTENRNMHAFIKLLAEGKVDAKPLITHRFPIGEAPKAYELITGKTGESFLGALITYPEHPDLSRQIKLRPALGVKPPILKGQRVTIGLLGAGNFAKTTLLPTLKKIPDIEFLGVCTASGLNGRYVGDRFGFRYCTTDEAKIIHDPDINTVVIATRHHLHARQVIAALKAGKHVFVEKPLCINEAQLKEIVSTYESLITNNQSPRLMVGFNRRFAPMAIRLKAFLSEIQEPLVMNYRVNAGYIPRNHWIQDPEQGGGRIIGEVCHFVDFLTFLANALPVRVYAHNLSNDGGYRNDSVVIMLGFTNGYVGTITYVANGDKAFSKERIEVFGGGTVSVLDDFRRLELVYHGRKKVYTSHLRQDKGHQGEWEACVKALKNDGPFPIAFEEIVATTLTTFWVSESLHSGMPGRVDISALELQTIGPRQKVRDDTDID